MSRRTSAVKNAIIAVLVGLISSFSWVPMLLKGFTLPVVYAEGSEDICHLVTNNGLTTVTDEFLGGSTLDDIIFQCADKLFVCLNAINISDLSVESNKDHSSSRTIINSWDIRIDNVTSYIF
jgi:hypothetical protein